MLGEFKSCLVFFKGIIRKKFRIKYWKYLGMEKGFLSMKVIKCFVSWGIGMFRCCLCFSDVELVMVEVFRRWWGS